MRRYYSIYIYYPVRKLFRNINRLITKLEIILMIREAKKNLRGVKKMREGSQHKEFNSLLDKYTEMLNNRIKLLTLVNKPIR